MPGRQFKLAMAIAVLAAQCVAPVRAQNCDGVNVGRVAVVAGGILAVEGTAIAIRHGDWWPGPSGGFTIEWTDVSPSKGQDRLLHSSIAYQASQVSALAWDWACLPSRTAGWLGAVAGVAVSLPKEIGDGFQLDKGFSAPDMAWTAAGALLPALHRSWPASRTVSLKVFYWPSREFLESDYELPQLENDYAGQRFYLTLNPGRLPSGAAAWPDWLGIAVGHSVPHWVSHPPAHDWFLTLDLDLRGLATEDGVWRSVAGLLDQWHIPMPGVRVRDGEVSFGVF